MNSKRRAELQRKLSMGAVPRPPADLSDRIKADIPQYLRTVEDRDRFTGSVAFSMRVAASILIWSPAESVEGGRRKGSDSRATSSR